MKDPKELITEIHDKCLLDNQCTTHNLLYAIWNAAIEASAEEAETIRVKYTDDIEVDQHSILKLLIK